MLRFCPNCYAEISESSKNCLFCNEEIVLEDRSSAKFTLELAGLPVGWSLGTKLLRGTLLNGRFSLLQFKSQVNGGDYYIALDQALADYCFAALWEKENEDWRYHWQIRNVSSIKEVGNEQFYSVFSSQEGLPLVEALLRLGWNRQRVWEIIRQICVLLSPVHDVGEFVGYVHPDNFWVQNDGQVLFSTQKNASQQSFSWQEEIRAVIHLLFWLIEPQKGISWEIIPFKLQALLQECWDNPVPAEHLWKKLDLDIREKGWFHLSKESAKQLLNHHFPNMVLLNGEELSIPSSIQLCVWNAVTGTWKLKNGFLILQTNVMALFENGFVEQDNEVSVIEWMKEIQKGNQVNIESNTLHAVLMLYYGNQKQGHILLAKAMRETQAFDDWFMMARVLCVERDRKGLERSLQLAGHWANTLENHLDIAALLRWEEGDIFLSKKKLQSIKAQTAIENLKLAEAWYALFYEEDRARYFWKEAQICCQGEGEREYLWKEMRLRFGAELSKRLFSEN